MPDDNHPTATPGVGDDMREAISVAVGWVLFNVNNYPESVQLRILGLDTNPLRIKIIDAVIAALTAHPPVQEAYKQGFIAGGISALKEEK